MHAAHRRAEEEAQALDPQHVRRHPMLRLDHVAVVIVREAGVQAVAGLGRAAVADAVDHHDVILGDVQRLAGAEHAGREAGAHEAQPIAARAVEQQHRIVDLALRILVRRAQRLVADAQGRQALAGPEAEVLEGRLMRCRRKGGRGHSRGLRRHDRRGGEPQAKSGDCSFHRSFPCPSPPPQRKASPSNAPDWRQFSM